MPAFVDPKTGERFENVPDQDSERAQVEFGLVPADQYDAEQRSGGFGSQLQTAGEEALRQGAALIPGVDAGAAPAGLTELEPGQEGNALTDLYSPEARERRLVNPTAAAIGGTAPVVAAGLAVPGAGALGAAATLGLDALSGYSQEAVDAEMEGRGITGSNVLRNAALNSVFSLGAAGLGAGARAALRGGKSVVEAAAERAAKVVGDRAAAARGEDLVEAMADPAARDAFMTRLADETRGSVKASGEALEQAKAPKVATNPNAQRDAVEAVVDLFEKSDPDLVRTLREAEKGSGRARLDKIAEVREQLPDDHPLAQALDQVTGREDLWGQGSIQGSRDIATAKGLFPGDNASTDELLGYADALRKIPGMEKHADDVSRLVERTNEARVASTIQPQVKPKDAAKIVAKADGAKAKIRDTVVGRGAKRGSLQAFTDQFQDLVSNAEKRETFQAFEATMRPTEREALSQQVKGLAQESLDAIAVLPDTTQGKLLAFAEAAEKSGSAGDLDRLKNALQTQRKRYAKLEGTDARARDYMDAIDQVEPRMRAALEDPKFVGKEVADLQRARNEAWSNPDSGFIRNQNRMKAAGFNLLDIVEQGYDGRPVLQADARAFESLMNAPPEQAIKALDSWVQQIEAAKSIARTVAGKDAKAAAFLKEANALQQQANDLWRLKLAEDITGRNPPGFGERLATAGMRRAGGAAGAAVGGAIGGVPGAVVGGGLGMVADAALSGTSARAVWESASDRALQAIAGMKDMARQDAALTAKLMLNAEDARRYLRLAGDIAPAIARFKGEHSSERQAFDGYRDLIDGFAARPESLVNLLVEEFGDVEQLSPKLQREMIAQAVKVAGYLSEHMPGRRNVSVVYPQGTPASSMEIRQFAYRFTAATDPASVFLDARAGRLQKVQVDTLQALWPGEYEDLRTEVLTALGSGKVTTRGRQHASLLFGFDSAVDPALGTRTRQVVALAREAQEAQKSAAPSSPAMSRSKLPSSAAQTPGGISALELGQQMTL